MCIITDKDHRVISISLIPGLEDIPEGFNVYFPYRGGLPVRGQVFTPRQEGALWVE